MVVKKPKIVIIGAGMAGLTAAHKLYTSACGEELFDLCVVEGGARIGGRINTAEFGGVRIEMGATWIHGIGGSPIHRIAQETHSLESQQPFEGMDGFSDKAVTVEEGGLELDSAIVEPVSTLFRRLTEFSEGKQIEGVDHLHEIGIDLHKLAAKALHACSGSEKVSVGSFLRQGLHAYWESIKGREEKSNCGNWRRRLQEEAVFAMLENTHRTYTSAADLETLDYAAESEYRMFHGEEITIAKGYLSVIESLASVLPAGLIQLGRTVSRIEWIPHGDHPQVEMEMENNGFCSRPVLIHFGDGSIMEADHVIVTVSLGVLKAGIREDWGLFDPPLPSFKSEAISKLGFGVVNKLFVQLGQAEDLDTFPFLQMAFHRSDSNLRHRKIPWWMRRTASLCPIHHNSRVLLSWFSGKEALELESLGEEEIIDGVSTTVSSFLQNRQSHEHKDSSNSSKLCNGDSNLEGCNNREHKFVKVLKSQWGTDPLFLGSYSYVAVGSSGANLDSMAEPLPENGDQGASPPLQILFAGEATHRTHYSTTHGAYFSGLREAIRLLKHYNCGGISELLHH